MTSVTMVTNDSAALHTTKTNSRNVTEVQPYPASQTVKEQGDAATAAQQKVMQKQRRERERRQQKQAVLLDTRSGHDRRNAGNPEAPEVKADNDKKTVAGIDVYT